MEVLKIKQMCGSSEDILSRLDLEILDGRSLIHTSWALAAASLVAYPLRLGAST
jgi:hypothetical protein